MSRIEDEVCKKIQQRAAVGKKKYGVTMERGDLSLREWLTHLQEELMDAAEFVRDDSDDGVDLREALDGCSLTLDEQEAIYGFTF